MTRPHLPVGCRTKADRGVVVHAGAGETPEQELRRLRREVETLRQGRDFAKKAAVFFAKESR